LVPSAAVLATGNEKECLALDRRVVARLLSATFASVSLRLKRLGVPSGRQARDKPLLKMAMEMVLRRMKLENVTVHGFLTNFRDWAGNISTFPREIVGT